MLTKKTLFIILLLPIILIGCSSDGEEKVKDKQEEKTEKVESNIKKKENKTSNLKDDSMFSDNKLKELFKKEITTGKKYIYVKNINIDKDIIKADVLINSDSFDESIRRFNNAVSLLYLIHKEDDRGIKNIHISLFNESQKVHTSKITIEGVKNILSSMSNGIDQELQLKIYKTFDILNFIQKQFPEQYKYISDKESAVEIMRNTGETSKTFTDANLYNINKLSNDLFKKMIEDNHINLSNIHLDKFVIKADLQLDFSKKAAEEIVKIIDSLSVLYSFKDFNKDIGVLELKVLNKEKEKIKTYKMTIKEYESLLESAEKNKSDIAKNMEKVLDLTPLIDEFDNEK